ncbi:hypothetical protein N2152v2_008406 [Parachlorella kessleri]
MAECIAHLGVSPKTWVDIDAFLGEHPPRGGTNTSTRAAPVTASGSAPAAAGAAGGAACSETQCDHASIKEAPQPSTQTWFLKHRKGVKGQAVYYYASVGELCSKLSSLSTRSRRDFVVQHGVQPLLLRGRKFVLRAHVLLLLQAPHAGRDSRSPQAFLHRDVIVVEHAQPYRLGSSARALHISSCGRGHPRPYLLTQLHEGPVGGVAEHDDCGLVTTLPGAAAVQACSAAPAEAPSCPTKTHQCPAEQQAISDEAFPLQRKQAPGIALTTRLQRSIWEQMGSAAAASLVAGAGAGLVPQHADPQVVFYHLFGYDFIVDRVGKVQLLEVNAYPAIASGTMAGVDRHLYTRLVRDLLGLVVLPMTDGVPPDPGGFVGLDLLGQSHHDCLSYA